MTRPERVLLATRSVGKLAELRPMFAQAAVPILDLGEAGIGETAAEDGLEVFPTFEENALAKARYFAAMTALPTAADDSGLEVSALNGQPGVRTKRWSGRTDLAGRALDAANNAKLIAELGERADRSARYVCVAAYVDGIVEITRRGEACGRIVLAPRGTGGFGYDPYFESEELGCTFGEADPQAKERVSHRGRAFRALLSAITRER